MVFLHILNKMYQPKYYIDAILRKKKGEISQKKEILFVFLLFFCGVYLWFPLIVETK